MARGIGLLLAGLAAYGYYKYSKMSEVEKQNLKSKGQKIWDENVPDQVKSLFNKNASGRQTATTGANGNSYGGV
jgi:hypothetical protein